MHPSPPSLPRRRRLGAFLRSREANIGITLGLLMMPMLGLMGLAIDFGQAAMLRNRLQVAADAAALGVIAEKAPASLAAQQMTKDGAVAVGETDGRQILEANLSAADRAALADVSIKVEKAGNRLSSKVSFAASSRSSLLGLFGHDASPVAGSATGEHLLAQYVEYYILIDNTPSMGLAATTADIAILQSKNDGCAFACHISGNTKDAYATARANGVKLRIDTVRTAVQKLTQTATTSTETPDQFKMGVYTFGYRAEDVVAANGFTTITAPTSDLAKVRSDAESVDLMTIPRANFYGDQTTDFVTTLKAMNGQLDLAGDGSTGKTAQKVLFLVSDGVNDSFVPSTGCTKKLTGTRCQAPIDVAQSVCKDIKAKGVKIAALYTTYLPLTTNDWYNTWIRPFQAEIGSKMEACASPGLYYEVSPSEGIDDAMKALFQKSLRSVQLAS
ncbi:hypothetical protein GCM10011390_40680 [Aureimonas endophytica]|uniref:VWFA domain-containing protein n=1 Tax=Aureimonas endophytica TaxID=2027858 RepID=A0A916ZXG5_9HYPH|nr:pilus assembly protein TadG-related protein [Aureimonas endophytica]GGE17453.1 hypothetical protein GCM10011390_40680 [Aureimonas endophytica]